MADEHNDYREQLFDRHVDAVYAYVAFRLGGRSEDVADITQEVFLAAFWGQRDTVDNERQWLLGIARHKVVDYLRRRQREGMVSNWRPLTADIAQSPSAEQVDVKVVSVVLNRLSPRYAELLELKYIDGYSVRTIALKLSETDKAIESALTRAREAFRGKWRELVESSERSQHESKR